jgi:Zn-dependent peptidase ImmA (M78 family)/DNA-binding XRE family transcriptional regulator
MTGIGERLKLARRMARLSQQALADRAGVSKMAISKYEHSQMVPSSAVMLRLATALGVRMEFLLRPVSALEIKPIYRAHSRMNKTEEAAVIAQVQEWLERYLAIEALFPPDEQLRFKFPTGFPYSVEHLEDAEQAAEELRRAWQAGTDAIDNLTELLEAQGIKIGLVDGDVHFDACTFWVNDQAPVIVIKRGLPGDRQRFSLAHELGHIMLAVNQEVDAEKAAHRFAAAFLVPASAAVLELGHSRRSLDPQELLLLKQKYGMSMAAWLYRAKDLGILNENDAQRHWRQFSAHGWRKQEPGELMPSEQPQRMYRLVRRLLAEDVISRSRAKELLGERIKLFTDKEQAVLEMRH